MTTLVALLAMQTAGVSVIEVPVPEAKNVRVAVSIAAPYELGDREEAAWRIIPSLIFQGTREYTRQSIYDVSLHGGMVPQATGTGDLIRIEFAVSPSNVDVAAGILENLLVKPRFRPEDFDDTRKALMEEKGDAVFNLLNPARPNYDKATVALCESLWLQACRPERISVVLEGAIEAGAGARAFAGRFKVSPAPRRGNTSFDKPAGDLKFHHRPLTSFELAADPILFSDVQAGARLLAVHALGAGKQASVYRVLREQAGLSYEQRAILWPTAKGWKPRIYLLRRAQDGDAAMLQQIIGLLETDIAAWKEADLERAKAMAKSSLDGVPVDNLFWVDATGPLSHMAQDDASLRAYLAMAGAPDWDRERLKQEMAKVDLESLRTAAAEIVKTAKSRVIPGLL